MKYRRHGVKREHSVLSAFAAIFERVAALPCVEGVIPGRIANNPTRHPGLILKGETATGFKLLAKTTTSVQEAFVVVRRGQRDQALQAVGALCARPAARAAPPRAPRGNRMGGARAGRGGARPTPRRAALLPAARWQGELVRFSSGGSFPSWAPAEAPLVDTAAEPGLRRRLWLLRLRRTSWRRRFGVPQRRVPVP